MTTVQNPEVINRLTARYGADNVRWPMIFYHADTLKPRFLTFEIIRNNTTNTGMAERFFAQGQLPEYVINYLPPERFILPLTPSGWIDPPGQEIIAPRYSATYDYIVSPRNQSLNTIDIDYVWRSAAHEYFGLELSTFYMPMTGLERAKYLFGKFLEKRAGAERAHQFAILASVAELQKIKLNLVFVNVIRKGSNEHKRDGNVLITSINSENAERLHAGQFPADLRFCSYNEWLESL